MENYGWLVACFVGNGAAGEKLNLFYSPDGKKLFGGQSNPAYGADRLRDPSIIYHNSSFYVAYTLNDGVGRNFRIIRSETGAADSWSVVATVDVSALVPAGDKCWAPELIVDGSDVYVFFTWQQAKTSETVAGSGNGPLARMGWVKATNPAAGLKTWTAPVALSTVGFSSAYIDGVPVKYGNDYYFFSSGGSQIYRAKSTTGITGPYTQDKSGNWAGWGTGIEGPYVAKVGSRYRIYFDRYVENTGHWFSESSDLNTWTSPQPISIAPYSMPIGSRVRHGSFLQLPNMDAAVKAMSATMTNQGPSVAEATSKMNVPSSTHTVMGPATITRDPKKLLSGGTDAAGTFRLTQGGTYLVGAKVGITSATAGSSRTFVQYEDEGGNIYGRFGMTGDGEDNFSGSVVISVPVNSAIRVSIYHNQGGTKAIKVDTKFVHLGAN